jgi:hypothetical protein
MNLHATSSTSCELSFIVPAHNEETLLGRAVAGIRAAADATGREYEIIVVDDDSTDLPIGNVLCRWARLSPGCFLFARRHFFGEVGGFDPRYFAAEEWVLSRDLARLGRFTVRRETSITSGRKGTSRELRRLMVLLLRLSFRGRKCCSNAKVWIFGTTLRDRNRSIVNLPRNEADGLLSKIAPGPLPRRSRPSRVRSHIVSGCRISA